MSAAEAVFAYLDRLGVAYRAIEHAPAYTMADCAEIDVRLNALTPKNLFLTTKNAGASTCAWRGRTRGFIPPTSRSRRALRG